MTYVFPWIYFDPSHSRGTTSKWRSFFLFRVALEGQWSDNTEFNSWLNAETECRRRGGHLASVHDPDEHLALIGYLNAATNLDAAWLGINDLDQEVCASFCMFVVLCLPKMKFLDWGFNERLAQTLSCSFQL